MINKSQKQYIQNTFTRKRAWKPPLFLTSRKLNKWKNQQFILALPESLMSQDISLPPKLKRQGDTQNHSLAEKKPTAWNPLSKCLCNKIWTITDELLEAQCDSVRVKIPWRRAHNFVSKPRVLSGCYRECQEKIHSGFYQKEGKKLPFCNSQSILFLKRPALKRTYFTRA